jgi:hypothetical protein
VAGGCEVRPAYSQRRQRPLLHRRYRAEVASLAVWGQLLAEIYANPEFSEWFGRMASLLESDRREFYSVEV